jgi:non-specific serine/threonine protein kinase
LRIQRVHGRSGGTRPVGLGWHWLLSGSEDGSLMDHQRPAMATETSHEAQRASWFARTDAPLIPRNRELTQIVSFLRRRETSLLTLVGAPGAGKTTLARMAADTVTPDFRDGVWFVDLSATRDGRQVVEAIAAAVGIANDNTDEALTISLERMLRTRRVLLILDNFEQVLEARSVVNELLKTCGFLKVLVTSRAPLQLSCEQQCLVPPMPLPDTDHDLVWTDIEACEAIALFKLRAQAANATWELSADEAPAVAELCVRLDGLPLAIELAASWVAILPVVPMLEQFSRTLDLLVSRQSDRPERHQTLRAAIRWSEDLLPAEVQATFRRLAVFANSWTLEAALAVCEDHPDGSARLLGSLRVLADHHLIAATANSDGHLRFRMLQTIREYALDQLTSSRELESILDRHAGYFAELVRAADRDYHTERQSVWLDRLEQEYDNVRGALDWCTRANDATVANLGLEMAAGLWFFWTVRGHIREGRERLQSLLDGPLARTDLRARAQALTATGWLAWFNSEADASFGPLRESVSLWRELGEKAGAARALAIIGLSLAVYTDDLDSARETLEEAWALSQTTEEPWGMGYSAYGLGHLAAREGATEDALLKFEQSLAIRRSTGNQWGVGYSLYRLSLVALGRNDIARAAELQYQSLATSFELRNKRGMAVSTDVLACLAALQGRSERAARLFGVAQTLLEAANYVLPPTLAQLRTRTESATRADLGARAFAAAVSYGRSLSLSEGVAYALAEYGLSTGNPTLVRSRGPHPGLSRRETQIVRLVSQGLTDRQIATELRISPRTVDGHLRRIFAKLGVSSRSALTAWGVRSLPSIRQQSEELVSRKSGYTRSRLIPTERVWPHST